MMECYLTEDTAGWLIRDNLGFLASTRNFLQLSTIRGGLTHMHASSHIHKIANPVLKDFLRSDVNCYTMHDSAHASTAPHQPPISSSFFTLIPLSESDTNTTALRKPMSLLSDWLQTQWKDMIQSLQDCSLPFTNLPALLQP